jgi:hypothetical protein
MPIETSPDAARRSTCRQLLIAVLSRLFLAQVLLEMGQPHAAQQTLEPLADQLSPEELSESIDALQRSGPLETLPNEPHLRPFLRLLIEGK